MIEPQELAEKMEAPPNLLVGLYGLLHTVTEMQRITFTKDREEAGTLLYEKIILLQAQTLLLIDTFWGNDEISSD